MTRLIKVARWGAALIALALGLEARATSFCTDLAENVKKITKRILEEDFGSGRSFQDYLDTFKSTDLEAALQNLVPNQTWVDMGCGEEAVALREFGIDPRFVGKGFGVTVKPVDQKLKKALKKTDGRIKVLSGSFVETLSNETVPQARIITDLFGPFSYSTHPDRVLQKYLEFLEVGGSIYLYFLSDMNVIEGGDHSITRQDLGPWLNSISGVTLDLKFQEHSVKITKNSENPLVPHLELVRIFDFPPPIRYFRLLP
jgi:hypothetical protein